MKQKTYKFNLHMENTQKERVAEDLSRIAGLEDTRGYISKEKVLIYKGEFPPEYPLVHVEQKSENNYLVRLNSEMMQLLFDNLESKKYKGKDIMSAYAGRKISQREMVDNLNKSKKNLESKFRI